MFSLIHRPLFPFVWLIKKSKAFSSLSMSLIKLTGKSKYKIHPKHLIKYEQPWYLKNIKKTDVVLDLGCNNGQHTLKTAKKCKQIVGLDYDEQQLKIAKKSAKDEKISRVVFKRHDLEKKLPYKKNSFNKVLCLDLLEHIVNRKQLLKEIRRVLKPNGLAFIAIPNINTSWKKLQKRVGIKNIYADPDHKVEYSLTEINKVLGRAGFKTISLKPIVYDTPWIGFFDLLGGISLRLYAKIAVWKKEKAKSNLKESTGFRIIIKKT